MKRKCLFTDMNEIAPTLIKVNIVEINSTAKPSESLQAKTKPKQEPQTTTVKETQKKKNLSKNKKRKKNVADFMEDEDEAKAF